MNCKKILLILALFSLNLWELDAALDPTLKEKFLSESMDQGENSYSKLAGSFRDGKFTTDELKVWVGLNDFSKEKLLLLKNGSDLNRPDLIYAFELIARKDPKWCIKEYYTKLHVNMILDKGEANTVDLSWIPKNQENEPDPMLRAIIEGWHKCDAQNLKIWFNLLEEHSVKGKFSSKFNR